MCAGWPGPCQSQGWAWGAGKAGAGPRCGLSRARPQAGAAALCAWQLLPSPCTVASGTPPYSDSRAPCSSQGASRCPPQLTPPYRAMVLRAMGTVLNSHTGKLDEATASTILQLASSEMTRTKVRAPALWPLLATASQPASVHPLPGGCRLSLWLWAGAGWRLAAGGEQCTGGCGQAFHQPCDGGGAEQVAAGAPASPARAADLGWPLSLQRYAALGAWCPACVLGARAGAG